MELVTALEHFPKNSCDCFWPSAAYGRLHPASAGRFRRTPRCLPATSRHYPPPCAPLVLPETRLEQRRSGGGLALPPRQSEGDLTAASARAQTGEVNEYHGWQIVVEAAFGELL